jgi:hypothetical protein
LVTWSGSVSCPPSSAGPRPSGSTRHDRQPTAPPCPVRTSRRPALPPGHRGTGPLAAAQGQPPASPPGTHHSSGQDALSARRPPPPRPGWPLPGNPSGPRVRPRPNGTGQAIPIEPRRHPAASFNALLSASPGPPARKAGGLRSFGRGTGAGGKNVILCTPCSEAGRHISRHKPAIYPRGRHGVQYSRHSWSALISGAVMVAVKMACMPLPRKFPVAPPLGFRSALPVRWSGRRLGSEFDLVSQRVESLDQS